MQRLYRMLLVLCLPRTLRDAHGAEMEALFAMELAEARVQGRVAAWGTAFAAMLDVGKRAPREHWLRSGPVHTQIREHPVQSVLIDVRQAFRSFTRQRAATALIITTLGLAVAANTTVFTLLDSVFLRAFPFPDAGRLVYLNERAPKWDLEYTNINYPDFVAWQERAKAFESMALFTTENVNLSDNAGAERVKAMRVTHNYLSVLQAPLALGRMFRPDEDVPKGAAVVVLSNTLWRNRFASDSGVIGKTMRVNSAPYTIIGVLAPESAFPDNAALWLPLGGDAHQPYQSYEAEGIGRLTHGVTVEQALQSLIDAHGPIWADHDTAKAVAPRVQPLRQRMVSQYATAGKALAIAAALVLLIACANIGGAMLARSIARRQEIGIRIALGASASRVVRLLLTESLLLSAVAGVLGTLAAYFALTVLARSAGLLLPPWARPALDGTAVVFSVGLVGITTLLFGLAPALQARRHVASGAGVGRERVAGSVPERRMLSALVVVEVALASVLLLTGGLLSRAYESMRSSSPGYRTDGVATFRIALPGATYRNGDQQLAYYNRLIERLHAIPGVDAVGGVTCLPLTCHNANLYRAEGALPAAAGVSDPVILTRVATPDYFAAMGIQLVRGHAFVDGEGGSGHNERVAVINEQLAARYWPNSDPIGKRLAFRSDTANSWITVVGVVKDVRHYGLSRPMIPGLYLSQTAIDSTDDWGSFGFAVHSAGSMSQLLPAVQKAARELDADIPLFEVGTLRSALDASMAQQRIIALALSAFALVALGLAVGGIHAVLSYVVGRRRREIAIRMAVGARRAQVVRMVMRQGFNLTAIGVVIGVPLSIAVSSVVRGLMAGANQNEPVTYVLVVLVLVIVGSLATLLPASRAAKLDPKTVIAEGS